MLISFNVLIQAPAFGQFKFREPQNRQDPKALDEESGDFIWQRFQEGRAIGAFELSGELIYRPRLAERIGFILRIDGNWSISGQTTALYLRDRDGKEKTAVMKTDDVGGLLIGKDVEGEIGEDGESWETFETAKENERLWGELPFSYFDLAMPYLSWQRRLYAGPDRFLGRPAHAFRLINPDENSRISEVEVLIDEDFAAMLSVKLYNRAGELVERLRVGGFKQFNDYWAFSELIWEKREARESLKLVVDNLIVE